MECPYKESDCVAFSFKVNEIYALMGVYVEEDCYNLKRLSI